MKVGVLGGTFDPVHKGHLAIARETRMQLKLDQVIFMPAGQPWMKKNMPVSPAEHRLNMLKLAIRGNHFFKLSTIEMEHPGPSYAADSIAKLRSQLGAEDEVYFIMGWDSLAWLPVWREPERLISMCKIAAVPRPDYNKPDLKTMENKIRGLSQRVVMLDKPQIAISATEIRERVRQGLPIAHLVPKAVERYIREKGLYSDSEAINLARDT